MDINVEVDLRDPIQVFQRLAELQLRHDAREAAAREFAAQKEKDEAEWDLLARSAAAMLPEGKAAEAYGYERISWRQVRYAITHERGAIQAREIVHPGDLESLSDEALNEAMAAESPCRCGNECRGPIGIRPEVARDRAYLASYKRTNPEFEPIGVAIAGQEAS